MKEILNQALQCEKAQQWEQAIESYRKILKNAPLNTEIYMHLAFCLFKTGNHEESVDTMVQSFQIPNQTEALKETILKNLLLIYYQANSPSG